MSPLFFGLGYAAVFLGILCLLLWLRARARQDRAPFPENTRLLRGPGESLRRRIDELDDKIDNAVLTGLLLPLLVLGAGFFLAGWIKGGAGAALAAGGTTIFAVLGVRAARQVVGWIDRRRDTRLGLFGERIVAEHLETLKATGHRVFHDLSAGDAPATPAGASAPKPFNIDHVVVGPAGVFAIETKTRRKGRARVGFMEHEIIYDGRALAYPWGEDRHGLEQARRQADWLGEFLRRELSRSVPVHALLVFPGWSIIRKDGGASAAVNVLAPRELPAVIESGSPALDATTLDLIARRLEARGRDVEL